MRVDVLSTVRQLCAIREGWADLVTRCPGATIFQHPDWLIPWWEYSGSGQMWTLAFREGEMLAGLLPMFLHDWDQCRQVTLIGNGISDHLDLLARPEFADECADLTYDFLDQRGTKWDVCDWQDLPASSKLLARGEDRFDRCVLPAIACASLALPFSYDVFFSNLPHGLKRNIRRYGEHIRKDHHVRFETFSADPSGELVAALIRLHSARWQTKGEAGMLTGRERFFRTVTPMLAASNLLRIHVLEADEQIAGIIYQLWYGQTAYGYITGFDPAFDRYSPGVLLLDYAISQAIGERAVCWDFLRGEERYKFQWGAMPSSKFRLRVLNYSNSGLCEPEVA